MGFKLFLFKEIRWKSELLQSGPDKHRRLLRSGFSQKKIFSCPRKKRRKKTRKKKKITASNTLHQSFLSGIFIFKSTLINILPTDILCSVEIYFTLWTCSRELNCRSTYQHISQVACQYILNFCCSPTTYANEDSWKLRKKQVGGQDLGLLSFKPTRKINPKSRCAWKS